MFVLTKQVEKRRKSVSGRCKVHSFSSLQETNDAASCDDSACLALHRTVGSRTLGNTNEEEGFRMEWRQTIAVGEAVRMEQNLLHWGRQMEYGGGVSDCKAWS